MGRLFLDDYVALDWAFIVAMDIDLNLDYEMHILFHEDKDIGLIRLENSVLVSLRKIVYLSW